MILSGVNVFAWGEAALSDGQEIIAQIAVEVAKEISKDAYKDGLSPSVTELGSISQDILKALHLALAPVQFLAAVQDRYVAFLKKSVSRVPDDRRISPPPQIIGPVLEGIKYEPEGSTIEAMFSELLSRGMDRERVNEAHPAFPYLIRQLAADEADIIRFIVERKRSGESSFKRATRHRLTNGRFFFEKVIEDDFPKEALSFPDNLDFYINHLAYLGIAGMFDYQNPSPVRNQDQKQVASIEFKEYGLTDLGTMLAHAAIPSSLGTAPSPSS